MRVIVYRLLTWALNMACRSEQVTMTSPSGEVQFLSCEGWCGYWRVESHDYWAQGWRFRHSSPIPYAARLAALLRNDLHFKAAAEIENVLL